VLFTIYVSATIKHECQLAGMSWFQQVTFKGRTQSQLSVPHVMNSKYRLFISVEWDDVSELRPPMGLLLIRNME
jgi:hypothetical protein